MTLTVRGRRLKRGAIERHWRDACHPALCSTCPATRRSIRAFVRACLRAALHYHVLPCRAVPLQGRVGVWRYLWLLSIACCPRQWLLAEQTSTAATYAFTSFENPHFQAGISFLNCHFNPSRTTPNDGAPTWSFPRHDSAEHSRCGDRWCCTSPATTAATCLSVTLPPRPTPPVHFWPQEHRSVWLPGRPRRW